MKVIVVALERLLLGASDQRRACLQAALAAQDVSTSTRAIEPLDGRTFDEVLTRDWSTHPRLQDDPTRLSLAALDAEARYAAWVRDGASFATDVVDVLQRRIMEGGARGVLRTDARRRDVTPALEAWALYDSLAMLRCADDPPLAGSSYRSSIGRSWEAIADRLRRWGIAADQVDVLESYADTEIRARRLMTGAPVHDWEY